MKTMLVLAASLLLAADDANKGKADNDLRRLQGTWESVSMEALGGPVQDIPGKWKRTVAADRFTLTEGGDAFATSTFTLDPAKSPKAIDIKPSSGRVLPGIYELSGDAFKLCYARSGEERPKEFTTKTGTGYVASVWKRVKD